MLTIYSNLNSPERDETRPNSSRNDNTSRCSANFD